MNKILLSIIIFMPLLSSAQRDTTVLLDGSESLYADSFHWRQIRGKTIQLSNPDSVRCFAQKLTEGVYEFELTVKNEFGEDKDSIIVTVVGSILALDIEQERRNPRPQTPRKLKIDLSQSASEIILRIESPRHQQIICTIYDATGRALANSVLSLKTGVNNAALPRPRIHGLYFLRFTTYFDAKTLKLII